MPSTERSLLSHSWRSALIVGLGRSGVAAAQLARACGLHVRAYDQRAHTEDAPHPGVAALPEGCALHLGEALVPRAALADVDVVILSPGVPPEPVRAQIERFAPTAAVTGEMDFARSVLAVLWPDIPCALITGTNGKSTVTALLGELLRAGGRRPFVGGNLGTPLSELVVAGARGQPAPDAVVLECSSYQLETLTPRATAVAMILNVTPDHLTRYDSMDHYARTKARVFAGLDERGLALLDAGDPFTTALRELVPPAARVALVDPAAPPFAVAAPPLSIVGLGAGHTLHLDADESYPRTALRLAGRHNSKNALFALAAARHLEIPRAACLAGLEAFRGLPHRMEAVGEHAGVVYFNDSKATNVASVLASLDGFERPFVLIAGGRLKGDDLAPLRPLLARHGRGLVAVGEATHALLETVGDAVQSARASTMDEALRRASAMARPGDAVVLSPACASYDWYPSYRHRGDEFRALVTALIAAGGP